MSSPRSFGELEQVVGGADERPFGFYLFEATQKELAEASGMLDLAENGLDDLFSEAVTAAAAGASELGCHGGDARSFAPSPPAPGMPFAVAGATRSKESVDPPAGELSEIGLITEAGVGGNLPRVGTQDFARGREQRPECAAVDRAGLQALGDNDLMGAVDRNDGIVALDDTAAARRLDAAVGIGEVALGARLRGPVAGDLRAWRAG